MFIYSMIFFLLTEEEDIQSFSSAERRSKNKRKNEVRYISLKPFFKKERKRQHKMVNWPEMEQAELESNGGAGMLSKMIFPWKNLSVHPCIFSTLKTYQTHWLQ